MRLPTSQKKTGPFSYHCSLPEKWQNGEKGAGPFTLDTINNSVALSASGKDIHPCHLLPIARRRANPYIITPKKIKLAR